jgi:1-deoxy-D-xylulose 5-phosphate reductoisomerase
VLILGSTGSIGTQALEVIAANPDRFEVVGLAAGGGNPGLLAQQRAETGVSNIAVADEAAAAQVGDVIYAGPDAVTRLVENTEADVVLNALVGALGLKPTLAALVSRWRTRSRWSPAVRWCSRPPSPARSCPSTPSTPRWPNACVAALPTRWPRSC